jgi:hypothetical protein
MAGPTVDERSFVGWRETLSQAEQSCLNRAFDFSDNRSTLPEFRDFMGELRNYDTVTILNKHQLWEKIYNDMVTEDESHSSSVFWKFFFYIYRTAMDNEADRISWEQLFKRQMENIAIMLVSGGVSQG